MDLARVLRVSLPVAWHDDDFNKLVLEFCCDESVDNFWADVIKK